MIAKIKKNLKELGFNENEIKVYISLTQLGESPAAQVAKKSGLPRTTVISILQKLCEGKYASSHIHRKTYYYWIESPKAIKDVLTAKIEIAAQLETLLTDMYRSEADFPTAQIYDTKKSIRAFIEKTISNLEKNETIYTIDNPGEGNYKRIFSDNFGQILIGMKRKKGIITKTLIPNGTFSSIHIDNLKNSINKFKFDFHGKLGRIMKFFHYLISPDYFFLFHDNAFTD